MGAWGEGLYDDDAACDVRDSLSILCKLPADGDRILDLLLEMSGGGTDLDDDGGPTFWLAVADQFEKRGIACPRAFDLALRAIDSGADLRDLEARGMESRALLKRQRILEALRLRFRAPRPVKVVNSKAKAPKAPLLAGQLYAYPTMDGKGMNAWFADWTQAGFRPNGWGALLVVADGRLYDWFPWAAVTPLNVDPRVEPQLEVAARSKTLFKDGVAYCLQNANHLKRMGMKMLGTLALDADAARSLCARQKFHGAKRAVSAGWSVCSSAMSTEDSALGSVDVASLLRAA